MPLICVIKMQLLEQFLVNQLSHPVMPILIFFVGQFATFDDYVVDCFILISTQSTLAALMCVMLAYIQFDIMEIFSTAIKGN